MMGFSYLIDIISNEWRALRSPRLIKWHSIKELNLFNLFYVNTKGRTNKSPAATAQTSTKIERVTKGLVKFIFMGGILTK